MRLDLLCVCGLDVGAGELPGCVPFASAVIKDVDEAVRVGLPEDHVVPVGMDVKAFVAEKGLENRIDVVADFCGTQQTFSDAEVIGTLLYPQPLSPPRSPHLPD